MIRAGHPVDEMITTLLPFLKKGDTIIDGGNSDYRDTQRRENELREKEYFCRLRYFGRRRRSSPRAIDYAGRIRRNQKEILPVLQNIAAHLDDETPCCSWIGPDGSGHFVKTVHNGIEYGDMQLIAEAYSLLNVCKRRP